MRKGIVMQSVIILDGCGPEYLCLADMPKLNQLGKGDHPDLVSAMVPTGLTNSAKA